MARDPEPSALDEVRKAVAHAFAGVSPPVPENVISPCPCDECEELRAKFAIALTADWLEISHEFIEANVGNLGFLTPAAFQFFLPACLTHALSHWGGDVWLWMTCVLCPTNTRGRLDEEVKKSWQQRLLAFTPEQMQAIYAFLDLYMRDTQDWSAWSAGDECKRGLEQIRPVPT